MAENEIKLNFNNLNHLYKLIKETGSKYIKIGILGSTTHRAEGELTNAQIGFIQEFGRMENPRIPARSFLRMPLREHLEEKLSKSKKFSQESVKQAISNNQAEYLVKQLALLGEQIVLEAFATSGDGKWAPNAPITIAMKGSSKPLIDTGELRKSITSQVVKK